MSEASCDCCADRAGLIYRNGCRRCEARMLARAPPRLVSRIVDGLPAEDRAMVAEEREADKAAGLRR